jgi:hypothetical protein
MSHVLVSKVFCEWETLNNWIKFLPANICKVLMFDIEL